MPVHHNAPTPHTGTLAFNHGELFYRIIGDGPPLILLHGGPDFDHTYLLPETDRLSDAFRLIYYDQRGRGKSASFTPPEAITLQSEIADLEALRQRLNLERVVILGHSWGVLLALEYALQYPQYVSHLILLNAAPVSHDDYLLLRQSRRTNNAEDIAQLKAMFTEALYQSGDPDAMAAYYHVHFRAALHNPEHLELVIQRLHASFTQTRILQARAIEKQLMAETWLSNEYDLLPRLSALHIPTLVLHGEHDFVPVACATHITQAIPAAQSMLLKDCGHFSYLECPEAVHAAIDAFFQSTSRGTTM